MISSSTPSLSQASSMPMRRPRNDSSTLGISRHTLGSEVGSSGSWPAMVDSRNSASRALRVIGPIWSRLAASSKAP
ncbi:hypothetical protein D9M72_619600 [compost metagenome]